MDFFLVSLLFLVGLLPNSATVLGPRAQKIFTRPPRAQAISVMNLLFLGSVPSLVSARGPRAQTKAIGDFGVSTWTPGDPMVTIINTSSRDCAYGVETGTDSPSSAFPICPAPCIVVPTGETVHFFPGRGFNGALTATGSRHELNFLSVPGETWYDISMELDMSHETLGPSDQRLQADGRNALCGEPDLLAKANAAWQKTSAAEQRELLATGYLTGTVGGSLTAVDMSRDAPMLVRNWYQLEAGFTGYMVPGSVEGKDSLTEADKMADAQTSHVTTNRMTITIY